MTEVNQEPTLELRILEHDALGTWLRTCMPEAAACPSNSAAMDIHRVTPARSEGRPSPRYRADVTSDRAVPPGKEYEPAGSDVFKRTQPSKLTSLPRDGTGRMGTRWTGHVWHQLGTRSVRHLELTHRATPGELR